MAREHREEAAETAGVAAATPALIFDEGTATVREVLRQVKDLLRARAQATEGDAARTERDDNPAFVGGRGRTPRRAVHLPDEREESLEATVLLGHVLGASRAQLLASPQRRLSAAERQRYATLLRRRLRGEPVAYLVGHREFFGLDLLVDRRVLVPRPETELLVEQAIVEVARLGAPAPRLADVGTGSGAIAVSLAVHLPRARIYALDLSAPALAVAAANCLRHGVAERVTLLHGDLLSPLPAAVHVLVANLPYVSPEELATLAPEVAEHEPRVALLAAEGGLAVYRRLIAGAPPHVLPSGAVILEIAPSQAATVVALARASFPHAAITVGKDYAGLDRVVLVRLNGEN